MNLFANVPRPGYELAAIEYCATTALRRLLEEPVTRHTRAYLSTVLSTVADLLPSRFAFEEEGGFLTELEEALPERQPEILHHRIERAMLSEDLGDLRDELEKMGSEATEFLDWNERMYSWLDRLAAHEEAEDRLEHIALHADNERGCVLALNGRSSSTS